MNFRAQRPHQLFYQKVKIHDLATLEKVRENSNSCIFTGFEKIPETGGALIAYYHGPIPLDYLALLVRTYLEKGRLIRSVMDKNLIMMPGAETLFRTFGFMPGGREEVIKLLKDGHLVGVAPGGGYEAQLATLDYPIMWKQRRGFAVVAKEARVPIIPMFTENIKEAYVNMQSG